MKPLVIPDLGASLSLSSPFLILSAVGMLLMLLAAKKGTPHGLLGALALAGVVAALAANAWVGGQVEVASDAYAGMLRVDAYGVFCNAVVLVSGAMALLMSDAYLRRIGVAVGEYYALVLFALVGMGLMAWSADLMMVFIALEVMSIAVYVLCALKRADPRSVESGFKYFILGAFSSGLMLYGIALVYGALGSTSIAALSAAIAGGTSSPGLLAVGGALLLVGFGFKVASVPFHLWTPDVYQGAPTSVTALMASGVKAASFAALGRLAFGSFHLWNEAFTCALWLMSASTMLVGNIAALVQTDLKRMLAYSSIAHAGYLLMAVVASTGDASAAAPGSLLFYLLAYAFMNAGAFAVLALLARDGGDRTELADVAGLGRAHPWLAAGLSLCLLSLAGLPPTMGFVGKFYLFTAAVSSGHLGLAMVGAVGAAAGIYYYLRPMIWMYMRDGHPHATPDGRTNLAIALAAVAMLAMGLLPSGPLAWAADAVASVAR
jgi:NADH-quinone oxidoreductase subunit N